MFRDLKPYDSYGVPASRWIPEFPSGWAVLPGAGVLSEVRDKNGGLRETTVLSLSYGQVIVKPSDKLHGLVPASYETYQILEPGDIVFRPTDLQNDQKSLRVGQVGTRGIITSAYIGLRPRGIHPQYAFLYLKALDYMKVFYGMGSGLRQNIAFRDFKRLPIPVPSRDEQDAIVKYLVNAHERINRAVASKRRLIALLEEAREAAVADLLAGGPGAPPGRDSGFEHVGTIPRHWDVVRGKRLFREFDRRSGSGAEPLLSLRVRRGLVRHADVSAVPFSASSLVNYKVVEPGAVVMNRMRAASGVFAVASEVGLVSPDYATLRVVGDLNPRFYLELFKTRRMKAEFRRRSTGLGTGEAGFMRLQYDSFGQIPMPVPPRGEQDEIVGEIEARTEATTSLIERTEREIGLLDEFWARLTAEVVTGQLDIRDTARQLPALESASLVGHAVGVVDVEMEDE